MVEETCLPGSNALSFNANAINSDSVEIALNVLVSSFGVCSLLIQSDKHKGGSGP